MLNYTAFQLVNSDVIIDMILKGMRQIMLQCTQTEILRERGLMGKYI
jgi:hypothetical protein